ncbi:MAG: hypothetical protein HN348_03405, partial [Proteobacteria bacterium]|nr:hypothetical protein [Pseudomonadota bacterium]
MWSLAIFWLMGWAAEAHTHNFRTWQAKDGLQQNIVHDIVQTEEGYLWLATAAGLVRFDGVSFERYASIDEPGLVGDRVHDLLLDRQQRLWLATDLGVSVLINGEFRIISEEADGVSQLALAVDDTVWAATFNHGLQQLPLQGFVPEDTAPLHCVAVSVPRRHVWSTCRDGGGIASRLDPATGTTTLLEFQSDEEFTETLALDDGSVLVGTTRRLYRWKHDRLTPLPLDGIPSLSVSSLTKGPDGNIWVGSRTEGILQLTGDLEVFGFLEGAPDHPLEKVFHDREGITWLGFAGGGLVRATPNHVATLPRGPVGPDKSAVFAFRDDDGGVWSSISSCDGVTRTTPQNVARVTDLPTTCVWAMAEMPSGTMWFGGWRGGATRYDRNARRVVENLLPVTEAQAVLALHPDEQQRMWIGSTLGVDRWEEGSLTHVDAIPQVDVRHIFEDNDGSMWFGTMDGLFHLVGDKVRRYGAADGLASGVVRHVVSDGDVLLVATYGGGLHYLAGDRFRRIGAKHGLTDDFLSHIFLDQLGYVWVSGNGGLCWF